MNKTILNLRDLLRLAFSGTITWYSKGKTEHDPINWVALTLDEIQPGDLLLLPVEQVKDDLLVEARERRVKAVLLLGKTSPAEDQIPADMTVVSVPGAEDARETQRKLLTVIANQRAAYMERGMRVHKQLSQLAAEGGQLTGVARAMLDISGRGVLVQDKRLGILAEFPSPELQPIWGDLLEQLSDLEILPESLRNRKQAGQQHLVINQSLPGGVGRIVVPIRVGEVARGYLSLMGMEGELDVLDRLVAEEGALVCAVEMARAKAVRETEKRLHRDLLDALLQEDLSPRDASLWVQTMGLDQTQEHVALHFAWDAPSPPSRRRLETIVNGEVASLGARVIISPAGSNVICFCQVSPGESRPKTALTLGRSVLEHAYNEYPEAKARCGVGTPVPDLNKWHISFREAGQALEMARRLSETKPLYYPDLSVYRLLLLIEHNPELMSFQEEVLGPLLSYEGGNDYIRTLEAFFEQNGNLSRTARSLYIHRNTLSYRMERIAEITGLNLNNPDTSLALQLALRIYRMKQG